MLDADPQGNLKSYAYNNLALACWWHKNPIHSTASAEHSSSKVEDDFNKTKDIFSISISNAEKVEEIEDDERLMKMKETLDSKNK